jgi:hypothetical protein
MHPGSRAYDADSNQRPAGCATVAAYSGATGCASAPNLRFEFSDSRNFKAAFMAVRVHHGTRMDRVLAVHQPEFAFTVAFHYVCPQVTLSLALLIFILGRIALRMENPHYDRSTHFWTKVFAINFVLAVVTGMPMAFQFEDNWTGIAKVAGSVIGQTLATEECSTFFWRVRLLSLFVFDERRLGQGRRFTRYRALLAAPSLIPPFQVSASSARRRTRRECSRLDQERLIGSD